MWPYNCQLTASTKSLSLLHQNRNTQRSFLSSLLNYNFICFWLSQPGCMTIYKGIWELRVQTGEARLIISYFPKHRKATQWLWTVIIMSIILYWNNFLYLSLEVSTGINFQVSASVAKFGLLLIRISFPRNSVPVFLLCPSSCHSSSICFPPS